jgi:hypothetical protein
MLCQRYAPAVQLREIMTSGVITAAPEASASERMGALPQFFFHERG